jgi:hypothetical protein
MTPLDQKIKTVEKTPLTPFLCGKITLGDIVADDGSFYFLTIRDLLVVDAAMESVENGEAGNVAMDRLATNDSRTSPQSRQALADQIDAVAGEQPAPGRPSCGRVSIAVVLNLVNPLRSL